MSKKRRKITKDKHREIILDMLAVEGLPKNLNKKNLRVILKAAMYSNQHINKADENKLNVPAEPAQEPQISDFAGELEKLTKATEEFIQYYELGINEAIKHNTLTLQGRALLDLLGCLKHQAVVSSGQFRATWGILFVQNLLSK